MTVPAGGNLFDGYLASLPAERFDVLVERPGVRLQRIVSTAQATPPGQWYDQDDDEWVVVLRGSAGLRFQDADAVVTLRPGDWRLIPARCRHRVDWTDPDQPTVWLALHLRAHGGSDVAPTPLAPGALAPGPPRPSTA
jgi:cupin 2 domain-containing protein